MTLKLLRPLGYSALFFRFSGSTIFLLIQIKMAAEAKSKPIDTKSKSNFKDFEFDRPMTSKEKEEYFREKASQARKSGKEVVSLK